MPADPSSFWPKGFGRALQEAVKVEQTSSGRMNLLSGALLTVLAVAAFVTGRGSFIEAVIAVGLFMLACIVILFQLDQAEQRARFITGPSHVHDVQEVGPPAATPPRSVRRGQRAAELPRAAGQKPKGQRPKRKNKKKRRR